MFLRLRRGRAGFVSDGLHSTQSHGLLLKVSTKSISASAMLRASNLANVLVQNHVYGDILKRQITGEFRVRLW